ncbi:hypothetical protein V2J09_013642 [Rumex salicifolius]
MEEDARRESVLAKLPILQPNFKPVGVSQSQRNKFQELHRRRLQIKSKFKSKKKPKGNKEFEEKDLKAKGFEDEVADLVNEGSNVNERDDPKDDVPLVFKKRKLHWGLDTKERWERKSNIGKPIRKEKMQLARKVMMPKKHELITVKFHLGQQQLMQLQLVVFTTDQAANS